MALRHGQAWRTVCGQIHFLQAIALCFVPTCFENTEKRRNGGSCPLLLPYHQVGTSTYVVRCTHVRRLMYVRTTFDVRAYGVRCTSSSEQEAPKKRSWG